MIHVRFCGKLDGLEDVIEFFRSHVCIVEVTPSGLDHPVMWTGVDKDTRCEGEKAIRDVVAKLSA